MLQRVCIFHVCVRLPFRFPVVRVSSAPSQEDSVARGGTTHNYCDLVSLKLLTCYLCCDSLSLSADVFVYVFIFTDLPY